MHGSCKAEKWAQVPQEAPELAERMPTRYLPFTDSVTLVIIGMIE
jgi:hypothetical protein